MKILKTIIAIAALSALSVTTAQARDSYGLSISVGSYGYDHGHRHYDSHRSIRTHRSYHATPRVYYDAPRVIYYEPVVVYRHSPYRGYRHYGPQDYGYKHYDHYKRHKRHVKKHHKRHHRQRDSYKHWR